ncbi:hypothetical protein C1I91_24620 [Clostridium manihotivorum]|uniref:Uncharacterized protein n=2 Tax=Clostridium manihotivorum TaxID=2320868 RepID=A0A410DZP8_9CLOT|nr:hypothetical protein C1I91_24620 [Clostridium manihotivorum]
MNMNKENFKTLNRLCVISVIISMVIGFFNPYEHYLALAFNLWYPFAMFIYFINVKVARKAAKSSVFRGGMKTYVNDYNQVMGGKILKIFMVGGLCFLKIMFLVTEFVFYSGQTNMVVNYWDNKFLLDNALLMFILSTIAETVVVVIYCIRIWKERDQGDEATLCR